ncbi:hypothetical protein [Anoxynatronum buryatiense]|uniref:Uncharacterized protein n=1 Tax=Anoxynatronum buryatiense TaxID=489973 RepID=A0AA45WX57_9CLOT|nr:hypothetical protein [Anoxynatronum buryatiense]SMP61167.1 hypothetical protein SAMN06296020_1096 [Anoxynatronum buryatiense]
MNILVYQVMNLLLVLVLLGAPVLITVLLLRHFSRKEQHVEMEARLTERIRELEERVRRLEEG